MDSGKQDPHSPHSALVSPGFRNYADHTASEQFRRGVEELRKLAVNDRLAIMALRNCGGAIDPFFLTTSLPAVASKSSVPSKLAETNRTGSIAPETGNLSVESDERRAATAIVAHVMHKLWQPLLLEQRFPSVADWATDTINLLKSSQRTAPSLLVPGALCHFDLFSLGALPSLTSHPPSMPFPSCLSSFGVIDETPEDRCGACFSTCPLFQSF